MMDFAAEERRKALNRMKPNVAGERYNSNNMLDETSNSSNNSNWYNNNSDDNAQETNNIGSNNENNKAVKKKKKKSKNSSSKLSNDVSSRTSTISSGASCSRTGISSVGWSDRIPTMKEMDFFGEMGQWGMIYLVFSGFALWTFKAFYVAIYKESMKYQSNAIMQKIQPMLAYIPSGLQFLFNDVKKINFNYNHVILMASVFGFIAFYNKLVQHNALSEKKIAVLEASAEAQTKQ